VGIKADGVDLSKMYLYPYIGGDAVNHSREMLRPTDAALFSTFTASPLQDENGVTFQTTAQNALKPFGSAGFLPEFANVIGYYRRGGLGNFGNRVDLVSFLSPTSRHAIASRVGNGNIALLDAYSATSRVSVAGGTALSDNIAGAVQTNSLMEMVRNEASVGIRAAAVAGTQPSEAFNLGNGNGIATLGNYSFEWFYQDAMTGAQMIAMQARIHALQTVLNRAITY
jgi:hypothetical protein